MKKMIIYYSRSGNTEKIALQAQKDLKCEIMKIIPKEAYGNYVSSCLRVTKEKKAAVAPAFTNLIPDLKDYNMILVGYPIWAQDLPRFVADFMNQCDWTNKIVVPFATYGMSGINGTIKHLQTLCKGAKIKHPFGNGVFKKGDYDLWIKQILHEDTEE